MVFYRKYRPQKFADLVGQRHVVENLLGQLETGKISHGYLFCGPKGSGKTSTARIFAKAVNCLVYGSRFSVHSEKKAVNRERSTVNRFGEPCNKCVLCLSVIDGSHLDLIEIDAASNRNIDDVRDLREKIKLSPVSGRFKVYIIDEVHMLTKEAFNALLKTLEEPPAHAIFILCTTEVNKLPQTIISRVQRFNFLRATEEELAQSIERIAKSEGIKVEKEATAAIAKAADGSFRDAVSILDQVSGSRRTIRKEDIKNISILSDWNHTFAFVEKLVAKNLKEAVSAIGELDREGMDFSVFARGVILFLEKLLHIKIGTDRQFLDLEESQHEKIKVLAQKIRMSQVQNLMKLFLVAEGEIKLYPLGQIPFILAICKYCLPEGEESLLNQAETAQDSPLGKTAGQTVDQPETVGAKIASPPKSTKSLSRVEKHWAEFLNRVRPINAQIMAILRSTRPVGFEGRNLTLEVFYRFHKEKLEEPKVAGMLERILNELTGMDIGLKFVLAQRQTKPPEPVSRSDVVDVDLEHFEKISAEITEIFSK